QSRQRPPAQAAQLHRRCADTGTAQVPDLRVRDGRHGRQQRVHRVVPEDHVLVEDVAVAGEAAARALRPGDEAKRLPGVQLDRLLTDRRPVRLAAFVQVRASPDETLDPLERRLGRLELVRGVQDELLTADEQPPQFAGFDDAALAVLAGNVDDALERGPRAVRLLAHAAPQDVLLPRVQDQTRAGGEVDGLLARAGHGRGDGLDGWLLPAEQLAAVTHRRRAGGRPRGASLAE